MQRRHQRLLVKLQQHLRQRHHARGRFKVTHVRLHRADTPLPRLRRRAENPAQTRDLDRIAQHCARAVRLHVVDRLGSDLGVGERRAKDVSLRYRVRHREPARASSRAHRRAPDHAEDAVTVALCRGERLQHHRANAFTSDIAATAFTEATAPAIARAESPQAEQHVLVGVQRQVDAANNRQPTLTPP